ncbi:MAG: UrcA family protein [Polymorphobacter sp.]
MFTTNALRTVLGTLGTVIGAGVCLMAATAPAQAAGAPRATTVSYNDLNMASSQGRGALDMRIKQAARSVCENGTNDVRGLTDEARCVRTAVASAQARTVAAR